MPRLLEAPMQFRAAAEQCLAYLATLNRAPRTRDRYDFAYGAFRAWLITTGRTDDVRHFTDDAVAEFVAARRTAGVHPNSVRLELSALSTLAKFLMTRKDRVQGRRLLDHDPTRSLVWPQHQRPTTYFLFLEEQAAFLRVEVPLAQAFARALLWETGLRVEECCRANVADLTHRDGRWYLGVTVKGQGRQDERRLIPLSAELGDLWERYELTRGTPQRPRPRGDEPLLLDSYGQRFKRSNLSRLVTRIARRAGITRIPVSAHTLRHTANVNARAAGVDRAVRQQMLNHTDPRSLDRYEHLLPEETSRARDQVQAWLAERLGAIQRPAQNPGEDTRTEGQ